MRGIMAMGIDPTDQLFLYLDDLERAKLALVFFLHLAAFVTVFRGAAAQPGAFFGRFPVLTASWMNIMLSAIAFAAAVCVISILAGRHSGIATVLFVNAGVISLYVIEFTVMLSRGFFKRLLDEALQPEIRTAICFIIMVNAGYFTLMFLKDILLSDNLGIW